MDSILLHLCSGSLLILVKIANPEYLKIYKPKFCHKIIPRITVWPKFSLILVQWIQLSLANRNSQVFWVRICQENPRRKISCLSQPCRSGTARVIDTQDHQWSLNTCWENVTEHYYMHGIKELPLSLQNTLTHPCFLGSTLAVKMEEYRIREFRKSIKKKKKSTESLGYTAVRSSLQTMIIWYPQKTHLYRRKNTFRS